MESRTLTENIRSYITNRQRPFGLPTHEQDQLDAAALDGARVFDAVFTAGRQDGTFKRDLIDPSDLIDKLTERYGDPLTQLHACVHLASMPLQPGFIHGAAPQRVFCKACFTTFLLTDHDAMKRYEASTDCDACGAEVKDFHPGVISDGLVTYHLAVCADCLPLGW